MLEYLEHTTINGQRWDNIAWLYYGDANQIHRLITANPQIAATGMLPGGIIIKVPVLEINQANPLSVPPWKR